MDDDHDHEQGIRCHFCGRLLMNPEESSPPCQSEQQAEQCELYWDDWHDAGDPVTFRQLAHFPRLVESDQAEGLINGGAAPEPPPAAPSGGIGGPQPS